MNEEYEQGNVNYYRQASDSYNGLRYRLDGTDVVEAVVDTLKGGLKSRKGKIKYYYDEFCMMNDLGVSRAKLFLQGCINKVNHLTKYENEERIVRQMRALVKAWVFEVVLNAKRWAPEASVEDGVLINPEKKKIRNMRLVIQVVENAIYQSMLRATGGFEAENLSKIHNVNEITDGRAQSNNSRSGLFGLFGGSRRGGGDFYG